MDAWINPTTRSYLRAGGALTRDPADGLANAVYLRLTVPVGSWFGDASLGSRLHEIQREKDVARVGRLAVQYAQDALASLLSDGRAQSLDVAFDRVTDVTGAGRGQLRVTVVDARGQTRVFEHFVKVV